MFPAPRYRGGHAAVPFVREVGLRRLPRITVWIWHTRCCLRRMCCRAAAKAPNAIAWLGFHDSAGGSVDCRCISQSICLHNGTANSHPVLVFALPFFHGNRWRHARCLWPFPSLSQGLRVMRAKSRILTGDGVLHMREPIAAASS